MCVAQGMLLDLDAATLTVWVNGERKGVMVQPDMTDGHGRTVARRTARSCCPSRRAGHRALPSTLYSECTVGNFLGGRAEMLTFELS